MDTAFFISAKLFWMLARPEAILLLLVGLALRALYHRHMSRARILLSVAFASMIAIAIFPLGDFLFAPLEARYPAHPKLGDVAAIIMLGGAEDPGASATWDEPSLNEAGERYLATLSLARRFPRTPIYFAGGSGRLSGSRIAEAEIARRLFNEGGIAPGRLRLEALSRNTAENATRLRTLVPRQGAGQWILVTSAYHMPRAVLSFCRAGWRNIVPWPTDFRSSALADDMGWDFAAHLSDLNRALREWVGLLAYRLSPYPGSGSDPAASAEGACLIS